MPVGKTMAVEAQLNSLLPGQVDLPPSLLPGKALLQTALSGITRLLEQDILQNCFELLQDMLKAPNKLTNDVTSVGLELDDDIGRQRSVQLCHLVRWLAASPHHCRHSIVFPGYLFAAAGQLPFKLPSDLAASELVKAAVRSVHSMESPKI